MADNSYEEAIRTLRRLAGGEARAPAAAAANGAATPTLPPRAASPTAWSEQNYRDLVEVLPDAVVVIDDTGSIVLVNRRTEVLFGYTRDELLGEAIEILVPERTRAAHVALRDGFLAAPRTRPLGVGMELFGRRKDGTEFPVEISLSPVRGGPRLLVTSVIRDVSDRKRSEAKFRTLVENIPAVTFIAPLDDSTPELYVSPQIERLLGFSQKEWLEDPVLWHRQLHPDDRDRWNRHFAPTCSTGEPFKAAYRFLAKDGRVVWVHGSANVVRDEHDQLMFLQGVAFDITAIKEAEQDRERFFSLSLDLFCVAGTDGYFTRVNQAFTAVLGYSAEELLRRPFLDLVHPGDREATRAVLNGLARGEAYARFENRYLCHDGSYRWLQWTAVPSPDGRQSYAAARDVTREKEDEAALREQARLATLRADISAAVTQADSLRGMLALCAGALSRDLEQASASVWMAEGPDGPLTRVAGDAGEAEAGRVAATREPIQGTDPPSAGYPLLIEGRLLGVMVVSSRAGLSEVALQTLELIASQVALGIKRKQTEEELLRANAELERRVRERTEELTLSLAEAREKSDELRKYSYHATHDIKEPLRTVLAQIQRVTRAHGDQLPGDACERLGRVVAAVGRMEVLLERLRLYAQVNLDTRLQPVDCNEAVQVALNGLEASIEESAATVEVGELPTVTGMKEHLELLFQNLIGNALKYRAPDRPPRVEVGSSRHADGWLFWVRDNGEGIEPRFWRRIFGIAERLNARTSGWGYGLAICEKTVTRHGGRIWVASEPGQGSTFYFTLPAIPG